MIYLVSFFMCFITCFILYLWQTNKTVVFEGLSVCHTAGVGRLHKEREGRGMTGLGCLELSRRTLGNLLPLFSCSFTFVLCDKVWQKNVTLYFPLLLRKKASYQFASPHLSITLLCLSQFYLSQARMHLLHW